MLGSSGSFRRRVAAGVAAGSAGVTALNATTYLDMALRGRPASSTPERSVEEISRRTGVEVPGTGDIRSNRVEGLGALSGAVTGLGTGVVAALLGVRHLPVAAGAAVTAGAAMVAANGPMVRLGLTDPREWAVADWLADVVPHLAYGIATAWTLRALAEGGA